MNPIHRLAFLRYIVIDECLLNKRPLLKSIPLDASGVRSDLPWYKEDLLRAINDRIAAFTPHGKPIAMRTLEKDIVDMQALFGVKINKLSQGRRAHYQYASKGMSIRKVSLSADHAMALQRLFIHLESLHYAEGEEWWWQAESRMRLHFDFFTEDSNDRNGVRNRIGTVNDSVFESHRWPDASQKWLPSLSKSAAKARPVRLAYRLRDDGALEHSTCCIEWLAQEKEEWLVGILAWDEEAQEAFRLLLPIRSIDSMDDVNAHFPVGFQDLKTWSWPNFASQRMGLIPGVVGPELEDSVPVQIWLEESLAKQFLVDPLHPTQDLRLQRSAGGVIFTINVVVDSTLFSWVLQWGSRAQLLEPAEARHMMRMEVRALSALYDPMFGP